MTAGWRTVLTLLAVTATFGLIWSSPASADTGDAYCVSAATPPLPPPGGVVFSEYGDSLVVPKSALSDDGSYELGPGNIFPPDSCSGDLLTNIPTAPTRIELSPGTALRMDGCYAFLIFTCRDPKSVAWHSLWGGQNYVGGGADFAVGLPKPPPLPPGEDYNYTADKIQLLPQAQFLREYHSCRGCSLADSQVGGGGEAPADTAYGHDLSRANLDGATLSGSFDRWNLSGAAMKRTVIRGATFDGADLRGTQVSELRDDAGASLDGIRVGPFGGVCTRFTDSDLVRARFAPANPDPGCEHSPLLPGSSVSLDLASAIAHRHLHLDLSGAGFVSAASDRTALAGADLSGADLTGARLVGFPADLENTNFDGATLAHASFDRADLSGATLHDVQANGTSFRGAQLGASGDVKPASFAGAKTDLKNADFIGSDISGASFASADMSGAVFSGALAAGTDFNSVVAENTAFNGAHIYGNGQAFDGARDLRGADFSGAVLAGDVDLGGGFDFTNTDLTGAKFDGAQCVSCNFTGSKLGQVNFTGAYLPGAIFSGVLTLNGADLFNAWLYCGDLANSSCATVPGSQPRWSWPLALGSEEAYGPVSFASTNLSGVSLQDVAVCPDGKDGQVEPAGCAGHLLPDPGSAPAIPAPCSPAASDACPTPTSTLLDASALGAPLAVVAKAPPTWATTLAGRGYYVALDDGTIRSVGDGPARVVAGTAGRHCGDRRDACGDGGPAAAARLGLPTGLAVGRDGSLYVADPVLHRVRRIGPSGTIETLAGSGAGCASGSGCGDGGPATSAALAGPYGVWVNPGGDVFIADGRQGVREVLPDGTITTIGSTAAGHDIRHVTGDARGNLYATSDDPAYLLKIDIASGRVTKVVGTGTSGYNGNTDPTFGTLLPGTQVQIDRPEGVTMARDGDVVFADAGNSLIRAYVPSSGHVIDDLAGVISGGSPQGGYNGDGRDADQTKLDRPEDVTATDNGALFVVADTGNQRVRQIGPSTPVTAGRLRGALSQRR